MQKMSPLDVSPLVQDTCLRAPAAPAPCRGAFLRVALRLARWACHTVRRGCSRLAQGFPLGLRCWPALLLWALAGPVPAAERCPGGGPDWQALAPGLWVARAQPGDSDAANRGATSNLLAWRSAGRLWLLGSGGSPWLGRQAACRLQALGAGRVSDLLLPWPRAELTLGASAFPQARRWAHADVAAAMGERCPRCVARMAARLDTAAADLGPDPVRLPNHLLRGAQGRLGPLDWWRLARSDETAVLVLGLRGTGVFTAHGLAWGDGPPDLRDADPLRLQASLRTLAALLPPGAQVWPEQGGPLDRAGLLAQADYLAALVAAVDAAQRRGDLETEVPPIEGLPGGWQAHPRHVMNWQRCWALREALNL